MSNMSLIIKAREVQAAFKKAAATYENTTRAYQLTPQGRATARVKSAEGLAEIAQKNSIEGIQLINAKIEELDRAENDKAAERAMNTDYQERLALKLRMVDRLALDSVPATSLQCYFHEYENDTIALNALTDAIGGAMRAAAILPPDNNGVRQERLRKVAQNYATALNGLAELADETDKDSVPKGVSNNAILENLIGYLTVQDDNFSLSENEAWELMHNNAAEAGSAEAFNFHFKPVR